MLSYNKQMLKIPPVIFLKTRTRIYLLKIYVLRGKVLKHLDVYLCVVAVEILSNRVNLDVYCVANAACHFLVRPKSNIGLE